MNWLTVRLIMRIVTIATAAAPVANGGRFLSRRGWTAAGDASEFRPARAHHPRRARPQQRTSFSSACPARSA